MGRQRPSSSPSRGAELSPPELSLCTREERLVVPTVSCEAAAAFSLELSQGALGGTSVGTPGGTSAGISVGKLGGFGGRGIGGVPLPPRACAARAERSGDSDE